MITLLNFLVFTSYCWSIPQKELGPNDWYRVWSSPKIEHCSDMILDSANNIYITGYTFFPQNPLDYDMILIKYNKSYDSFISKSWNSSSYDFSYEMAMDSLNNIYLAGVTGNYSNRVFTLVKFDTNLDYQWNRTFRPYDDNRCYVIAIDSQDNIYLGGHVKQENGYFDICLVKYNSSGALQWYKLWSHFTDNYCFAIAIDSSDNVYLTGRSTDFSYPLKDDLCLLKYNSSGDLQWSRTHHAGSYEIGIGIALDSKNNVYIVGETSSDGIKDFLAKYSKDGVFQWFKIVSRELFCYYNDLAIDSKDNIYLSGFNKLSTSNGLSASVIKYDNNGSSLWYKDWGEPYIEECQAIAIDSTDNIFIAGDISAYEYQVEGIFIVKNPRTLTSSISINAYPILLIIMFLLLGILPTIYKVFKKSLKFH